MAAHMRTIGIGLIGCGAFGRFCLQAYRQLEGVALAGVADTDKAAADACGKDFQVAAYHDFRELVRRSDVHLIHVATPPATHHEIAMMCVSAGKHILCEKPLAMTPQQGNEMLAAAASAGVILPVNFILRYNRITAKVKEIIDSGLLGVPLYAHLTNCAADSKLSPAHWFWDREVSGGIFIEHGVHFFDLYRHWLGHGQVVSATASTRPATNQQDRVICQIRYDRGTLATHYHGFDQLLPMDRTSHRIVMELGDIRVDGWIPLSLAVDAAVSHEALDRLRSMCPAGDLTVTQEFSATHRNLSSRGQKRQATSRVRMTYTPMPDKQAAYAESVQELLADQIRFIRNPSHHRRVVEANGLESLEMAQRAVELAQPAAAAAGDYQPQAQPAHRRVTAKK